MEAARLGIQDFQLGGLSAAAAAAAGLLGGRPPPPLPEPWGLGGLSHALPGFLSHPQAAYASYLTSPTSGAGPHPPQQPHPLPLPLASNDSAASTFMSPMSPSGSTDSGGKISPGVEAASTSAKTTTTKEEPVENDNE